MSEGQYFNQQNKTDDQKFSANPNQQSRGWHPVELGAQKGTFPEWAAEGDQIKDMQGNVVKPTIMSKPLDAQQSSTKQNPELEDIARGLKENHLKELDHNLKENEKIVQKAEKLREANE